MGVREIWRSGSLDIAIPIFLPSGDNVFFIDEDEAPGSGEEKFYAEIATYIWLQENCPDAWAPIFHALQDGSIIRHIDRRSYPV